MAKTVILLLTRLFPGYHHKKGQETHFRDNLGKGKIHSIRANYAQWKHNLDKVIDKGYTCSLREWTGNPYTSPQREFRKLDGTSIGYQRITMSYWPQNGSLEVLVDGVRVSPELVARNEGLSLADFKEWFFGELRNGEKQIFDGIVIHFTDYRYL